MKKNLLICIMFFLCDNYVNAQTSWKGSISSSWTDALNWTEGVPAATVDVIIGDNNFTGFFQPVIKDQTVTCKTLTIGTDSIISTSRFRKYKCIK